MNNKEAATRIIQTLRQEGYEALLAGGCVRDMLLKRTPKDYDVATNAHPDQIEELFDKTLPIGKAFGVIVVIDENQTTEVATFRKETGTTDGRHPQTIHFCAAEEDAKRRDFTINGLFYDPIQKKILDYVDGKIDIKGQVVRAIGDPSQRFEEDHLRMLRAVRFSQTLGFALEKKTALAIKKMASLVKKISNERIESELSRTLTESKKPGDALKQLHELHLLQYIIPELIPMIGQEQPPQYHPEGDVFDHTLLMLNMMRNPSRELAYGVLLHDIGKPPTASIGNGPGGQPRIRFDGHAAVGAHMAEAILKKLRLPKKEIQRITDTIRGHMRFIDVKKMRNATLRKMVGNEIFPLEMELHRLDCLGSHSMLDNYKFLNEFIEELANEPTLPAPWINGHDLIKMGIPKGRQIGIILKEAYEAQIEKQVVNREELLEKIKDDLNNNNS